MQSANVPVLERFVPRLELKLSATMSVTIVMVKKAAAIFTFTLLFLTAASIIPFNTTGAQAPSVESKNSPPIFVENNGNYSAHYLYFADIVSSMQPDKHTETYAIDGGKAIAVS